MADRDVENLVDRYVRITRGPLDGNARGPIVDPDPFWDFIETPGPLDPDDLDELEVTD